MNKKRIMSGMRPTGSLHLGNYFGALENWVRLQNEYDCFFSIVDWHALTTGYEDNIDMKSNIFNIAVDWISAGLDPEKCTIFIQSNIKEIAELHLLLSMIVPVTWLERCPTYKDQLVQLKEKNIANYGFLGYPNLMTSDILIHKANFVPVGEDQIPHIELSREITRKFNNLYGITFPEPQAMLTKIKTLPGLDGRKMSKSYDNAIALSDESEVISQKIRSMITDPQKIRKNDPGHPEVCAVYSYHKIFSPSEVVEIKESCEKGEIGCVNCKKHLSENVIAYMKPMHETRRKITENSDYVMDVLREGNKKARCAAKETIIEVRNKMNLLELE